MKPSIAVISGSVGNSPDDIGYSFVFDEAHALSKQGFDVHVIRSRYEKVFFSHGMHFHGFQRELEPVTLKFFLRNFRMYPGFSFVWKPQGIYWENLYAVNACRTIERNKINLINAHFAYPEGFVGLLAKKRTGKPLVVTIHGYDILVDSTIGYGERLDKRINNIISRVLKNADVVIAASHATFNEVNKIVNDVEKIRLIPNGVDVQKFNPHIENIEIRKKLGIEKKTVVFTLRTHMPKYGLEYLVRAASIVCRERKDVFFIFGGEGGLRQYHEQLAAKLGLNGKVSFTGVIPQAQVPYYYAASDIVVIPSIQEGFGLVVTEAMACGKPVIGTKVGGILDQIIDGYNGLLVAPRSPSEIAAKILWLIDNPDAAKSIGNNGRKTVEKNFNLKDRIDRLATLYQQLITG